MANHRRFPSGRRDYTKEIIKTRPHISDPIQPPAPAVKKATKRSSKIKWFLVVLAFLIIAGGTMGSWSYVHRDTSPVPKNIRQSVNFPIYYPDPKKLPSGYKLNLDSFSVPVSGGVAYTVNYDAGKKIVFSVQQKPLDSELQTFRANYIPLHNDFQTAIGKAEIGAYRSQTLVSLPTDSNSWLIITAPPDINQDKLKQVVASLRKS